LLILPQCANKQRHRPACGMLDNLPVYFTDKYMVTFDKKRLKIIINTSQKWLATKFHDSMKTGRQNSEKHYNFLSLNLVIQLFGLKTASRNIVAAHVFP